MKSKEYWGTVAKVKYATDALFYTHLQYLLKIPLTLTFTSMLLYGRRRILCGQ